MDTNEKPLASYLPPQLDEARLARQYAAIVPRLATHRPSRSWAQVIVPVLALTVVVLTWLLVRSPSASGPSLAAGAVLQTGEAGGESIMLRDGTKLTLDAKTEITLANLDAQQARIEIARGGIDLDVAHLPNRSFVVAAAGYDVTVVGTRFEVRFVEGAPRSLHVQVARGRVRVTRASTGDSRLLDAGESWSADLPDRMGALPSTPPTPSAESLRSSVPAEATVLPPPVPTVAAHPAHAAGSVVAPSTRVPSEESAKDLLVRAQSARASGDPKEAARLLDVLRTRHRDDARAGLAAFELGRVRLDALKDPVGAVEAFEDAIRLSPSAPFREDAEARRIQAFDASGNGARCREAKRVYVERYPTGLHRADVDRRCTGP